MRRGRCELPVRPAPEHVWAQHPPGADASPIPLDIDATIALAHSEKEKKTHRFQRSPCSPATTPVAVRELLAILLRPWNAGSNTTAEHIKSSAGLSATGLPPVLVGPDPHRLSRPLA
jgi:hypothetical protein